MAEIYIPELDLCDPPVINILIFISQKKKEKVCNKSQIIRATQESTRRSMKYVKMFHQQSLVDQEVAVGK